MKPPRITKSDAISWAGGTQAELARRLGTTRQSINQWPDDAIPEGRVWQLLVLGYRAEDEAKAPAEQ